MRLVRPLIVLGLILGVACSSCAPSNSALKKHSHAAELLDDVAGEAREAVLELRKEKLDGAVAAARAEGRAPDEVRARAVAAAAEFDDGPAVAAVNTFVEAKQAYVRAVLAAARDDDPSWSEVKVILGHVVNAYSALRLALGSPERLPPIPDVVALLLSQLDTPASRGVA
jgi:hypothetical protein